MDVPPAEGAPARAALVAALETATSSNDRTLIIAAAVTRLFAEHGLEVVVVGGSATIVWDHGSSATGDVDLVGFADASRLSTVLVGELGLEQAGRYWVDALLGVVVEVPGWVLEPDGAEAVIVPTARGPIRVIRLEDLVLDRVQQWTATGADDRWRQAARLMSSPFLDESLLARRAASTGDAPALDAVRALAEAERAGVHVEQWLSHAVQRAHLQGREEVGRVIGSAVGPAVPDE